MSIIKRNSKKGVRWCVKVTRDGQQRWGGTFASLREARDREAELSLSKGGRETTCREFASKWTSDPSYARERSSTNRLNHQAIRAFVGEFGDKPLSSVTRTEARDWAAANTWRHPAVRAMFNDAKDEDLVATNPFAGIRLPQSRGRKDITALTPAEIDGLQAAAVRTHPGAYGQHFAAMITVAAYSGLRRGELAVVEWDDIDFDRDEISVRRTLSNDVEILPPKNGKPRTIVLPPLAKDALRSLPTLLRGGRVFSTKRGKLLTKSSFHYAWDPVRRRFGRPDLAWHELRHFTATYLIQDLQLTPQQAAHQLGHSDAGRLLMSLYAHPDEERMRQAIKDAWGQATGAEAANVAQLRSE